MNFIKHWSKHIISLSIIAGFILTVASYMELCSSACSQAHLYRFFYFSFESLGLLFFSTIAVLHYLSFKRAWLTPFVGLMFAAALGAEIFFLYLQDAVIGSFCPVCVSIASTIFIGFIASFITIRSNDIYKDNAMKKIFFKSSYFLALICGFLIAFVGVVKPAQTFADGLSSGETPYFGNEDSQIDVLIITDWFCPACESIEPRIEAMAPKVMQEARMVFVDYPIHPETTNFTPYNLSFMLKNKDKYFQIRKALHKLAHQTKRPSEEQVQSVVSYLGVTYKPLSFSDINKGINFFESIAKNFQIEATPTIIVINRENNKMKKLVGEEITEPNLLQTIRSLKSE